MAPNYPRMLAKWSRAECSYRCAATSLLGARSAAEDAPRQQAPDERPCPFETASCLSRQRHTGSFAAPPQRPTDASTLSPLTACPYLSAGELGGFVGI